MQPERLGSQRLATEIFKHAAVVMLYRTLKFLPVLQPRRDGVAIGARQQLDAVDVAGQLRQLVSGIFYRQMLHGAAQLGRLLRAARIIPVSQKKGCTELTTQKKTLGASCVAFRVIRTPIPAPDFAGAL